MFTGADDWGGDTMAWVSVVTGRQGEAGRPGSGGAGPGGVRARASWHGGDLQVETGPAGRDDARGRFVRCFVHGWMDGSWGVDGGSIGDDDVAAGSQARGYVRTSAPHPVNRQGQPFCTFPAVACSVRERVSMEKNKGKKVGTGSCTSSNFKFARAALGAKLYRYYIHQDWSPVLICCVKKLFLSDW